MLVKLDRLVQTGGWKHFSVHQYRGFVRRLRRLFRQLRPNVSDMRLRPAVVTALSALGIAAASPVQAQLFDSTMVNPFGLTAVMGYQTTATLVDIDADGDLDLFSGLYNGSVVYAPNTGTATAPTFGAFQVNPFTITAGTTYSALAMADMDNDGDLDMFMGEKYPISLYYLQNTGTPTAPAFAAPVTNPFGISFAQPPASGAYQSRPALVDLDADGDLDLMVGINYGNLLYYENTGSAAAPAFAPFVDNPFGLSGLPYYSAPTFGDLDRDGDFDLVVYSNLGDVTYYRNTGSPTAPAFAAGQAAPFGLQPGDDYTVAALADLDNDGDLDMLKGVENGEFWYQHNSTPIPPVITLSTEVDTLCDFDTLGPIPFTVNDPDSPLSSLTAVSINQGAITNGSIVISGTHPNYTISAMTVNAGNTNLIITASDTAWTVKDTIAVNVLNCSMAIDNDFFARTFDVYPNPASQSLHYKLELHSPVENLVLEMVDLRGRVNMTHQVAQGGSNFSGILDVSNVAAGIYFLRVRTELYRFNRKVVIE